MINYLIGKISHINSKYVVLESNWTGYSVQVSIPSLFTLDNTCRLFIYQNCKIDNKSNITFEFYGFNTMEEKVFFINLIAVPGIGPKTAINIMKNDHKLIIYYIQLQNSKELSKIPGITQRLAKVICENLYKFYINAKNTSIDPEILLNNNRNDGIMTDVKNALQIMGYSKKDIEYCLEKLKDENEIIDLSDAVAYCIKNLTNINEQQITNT